jgi:hypothetical protein
MKIAYVYDAVYLQKAEKNYKGVINESHKNRGN